MTRKLMARLHDGSEHEVKLNCKPEEGLKNLTGTTHRRWIDVVDGCIRYDSVVAFLIVDVDRESAINELLRELHAGGGGTLEEVTRELERRGIEMPEESRTAT